MNNLEKIITEYVVSESVDFGNTWFPILMISILVVFFVVYSLEKGFSFSFLLFVIFIIFLMFVLPKSDKSITLKEDYNIEMKEKDKLIEIDFNKKEKRSIELKDNFKVFLEKTNEEKYYVYFDENKKDKKEVSLNEIKETFGNIKRVETKKFSLNEINVDKENKNE